MSHSVFITGSNRGIGLEFARQYAEEGWKVYASCRHPKDASELQKLQKEFPNIEIIHCDLNSESEVKDLENQFKHQALDVVINNAGVLEGFHRDLSQLNYKEFMHSFLVNSVAAFFVSRSLLPSLKLGKQKRLVAISSNLGSIHDNAASDWNVIPYKASKAALNMIMASLSVEPEFSDCTVLLLHPGWVKTDMGGRGATLEVQDSVASLRRVILKKGLPSGGFYNYQGEPMAW